MRTLRRVLSALVDDNRLPHALLLEGPEGVGKFALARALAQYIHCETEGMETHVGFVRRADSISLSIKLIPFILSLY